MPVDPNRVAQFNQQGAGGAYTPQAQAFYRMLGGTNAPGIAKSRGPASSGLSAKMLQDAFNAYHPKQQFKGAGQNWLAQSKQKGHSDPGSALIAAWNAYHPNPAPTHNQPFAGIPGATTTPQPNAYSPQAQAFYNALPQPTTGAFGGPKVIGGPDPAAAFPLAAPPPPGAKPPSKKQVSTLQDAVKQNQTQAWNQQAAQANNLQTNPQASGQDVFPLVAQAEGLTPQEAQNVQRAMMRESGGANEWQAGSTHDVNSGVDPAYGPLQIIQKTFDAYAEPGWNRMNAYDSMRAAIRYAKSRYGQGWSQRMAASGY